MSRKEGNTPPLERSRSCSPELPPTRSETPPPLTTAQLIACEMAAKIFQCAVSQHIEQEKIQKAEQDKRKKQFPADCDLFEKKYRNARFGLSAENLQSAMERYNCFRKQVLDSQFTQYPDALFQEALALLNPLRSNRNAIPVFRSFRTNHRELGCSQQHHFDPMRDIHSYDILDP